MKRRASHGLRDFVLQSDNGECRSDDICKYLTSVGGELRTCCAYTPEIMAFIERLWGIINSMASAMIVDKGLSTEYWEYAQNYALDIYNNIPPSKTPKGQVPKSPNEKFYDKREDISLYKVFGCRAFVNIPKQRRRKNLEARATQGLFIGLDRSSYPGYMVYSPEFHTTYVSGNVVFHQNLKYDGTLEQHCGGKSAKVKDSIPVDNLDRYKYLTGTNHIDPDNGLLYKVIRVEEKVYRGQGTYIVAYRAQVLSDGRVSTKCDKEPYHVRDIEKYYEQFVRTTADFTSSDNNRLSRPVENPDITVSRQNLTSPEPGSITSDGGASVGRRSKRLAGHLSVSLAEHGSMLLFYGTDQTPDTEDLHSAYVCYVDNDSLIEKNITDEQNFYIESALCGDPIVSHCMTTGVSTVPDITEPNTIKQAFALPDRDKWKEAVNAEIEMIKQFNVLSKPMPLPEGAMPLNSRWVFKRKRDQYGNVIKYKARLTPQGCYQHFGVDYADTYAPVARMCTLRYVLALACLVGLQTSSCDFTNAFLNAELKEDVYINAPPGTPVLPKGFVYKLQRALYGLKQSPREWNNTLNQFMTEECGFRQLSIEKCLYIKRTKDGRICLYVCM